MADIKNDQDISVYQEVDGIYNKKIVTKPLPEQNIGIDTDNDFFHDMILADTGESTHIDLAKIESFSNISQNRNLLYQTLDCMAEDPTIAAALEIYAEEATEVNEEGKIMWAESSDENVAKFVNFLLDSINVDKYMYGWVLSLCKYGDVYLRLYRESDFEDVLFKDQKTYNGEDKNERNFLNEDVTIKAHSKFDKYTHYIEKVPNPAEIFELTRHNKSYAYIKAPASVNGIITNTNMYDPQFRYAFKKRDVEIYPATEFVHACIEASDSRIPEEVAIFINDEDYDNNNNGLNYLVRRGQSILYSSFKAWRELSLLKNALLLNRLTKSAITRIIQYEAGDMPKEDVRKQLYYLKSLMEQKSAINTGTSLAEYTNPGPMENIIYLPTRDGKGRIEQSQLGGDVDVKSIADIDFFNDILFSALRIPKPFIGFTNDDAGFSGGQSLSLVSSRFAKAIKKIQNTMIQAMTDAINLMLLDKKLNSYIGKFTLKMQTPITQAEVDRKDIMQGRISNITDEVNLFADMANPVARLKLTKVLAKDVITDPEALAIIQDEIDALEKQGVAEMSEMPVDETGLGPESFSSGLGGGLDDLSNLASGEESVDTGDIGAENTEEAPTEETSGETLPTPSELDNTIDFSEMQ